MEEQVPFRFPQPDEGRFLEKLEQLEGRLDDLEQKCLQSLAEVEIPDTWLQEWEDYADSVEKPDEQAIREWVEAHLKKLKGFEMLNKLEQKEIASLYQEILLFARDVLVQKENLSGSLSEEEQEVMNQVNNSIL